MMIPIANEVFFRPNGKSYRPRSTFLRSVPWEGGYWRSPEQGVIILGTLKLSRARPVAEEMIRYWYGYDARVLDDPAPKIGWWHNGMVRGERRWVYNETRGRPGVMFWAAES